MVSSDVISESGNSDLERGLLDLAVEISTSNVTAGKEFALFVLIKNPFHNPVWIHEVNVSLPSDLRLVHTDEAKQRYQQLQNTLHENRKAADQAKDDLSSRITSLQQSIASARQELRNQDDQRMEELIRKIGSDAADFHRQLEQTTAGRAQVTVSRSAVDIIEIGSETTHLDVINDAKINLIKITEPWLIMEQQAQARTIRLMGSLPDNVALQPGSTAVFTAVITVKQSLVFTPSQYRLQFYVNYAFEPSTDPGSPSDKGTSPTLFTNTVAHPLALRPSVYSIMVGSILGGGVGALVRMLKMPSWPSWEEWVITLLIAMILSAVAVIFMARKSDAQSFVSVEDFWGGILIGFLVGYTGTSFFEDLTRASPAAGG